MIDIIRKYRLSRRINSKTKQIRLNCLFGKDFCAAPWLGSASILNFDAINRTKDISAITIGDYCNLNAYIDCNRKGKVTIGDYVYSSSKLIIRCDAEVTIGNCCLFGPNVRIWDTNSHPLSASARKRQAMGVSKKLVDSYEAESSPIIIEDNVWLCWDVMVLAGVKIGQGSVVAAGSVVTRDIPEMSLAAGTPAKKISEIPE